MFLNLSPANPEKPQGEFRGNPGFIWIPISTRGNSGEEVSYDNYIIKVPREELHVGKVALENAARQKVAREKLRAKNCGRIVAREKSHATKLRAQSRARKVARGKPRSKSCDHRSCTRKSCARTSCARESCARTSRARTVAINKVARQKSVF